MSDYMTMYSDKMELAAQICLLAEKYYRAGLEPDEAMELCKIRFKDVSKPLFHAALKEALDMMEFNPDWGK